MTPPRHSAAITVTWTLGEHLPADATFPCWWLQPQDTTIKDYGHNAPSCSRDTERVTPSNVV